MSGEDVSSDFVNELMRQYKQNGGKFPKEGFSDSMTIISRGNEGGFGLLWRPNNYRRKLTTASYGNIAKSAIFKATSAADWTIGSKLSFLRLKQGLSLQFGRSCIVAIYSQPLHPGGLKEVWHIVRDDVEGVCGVIEGKKEEIRKELDGALFWAADLLGVRLPAELPVWLRFEDWVKGEEFIDSLPQELVIHDTFFKKVYSDGVEFKGSGGGCVEPAGYVKSFIRERAVEERIKRDVGLIASELQVLREGQENLLSKFVPAIEELSVNMKAHVGVMKGINGSFRKFNKLLRERQARLGEWK